MGVSSRSLTARLLAVSLAAGLTLAAAACTDEQVIQQRAIEGSRPVTFRSADGVQLSGRLFGPAHATAGVVLAHMLPADQSSWFDFANRLGDMGYRALTFDFRGFCPGGDAGCSKGSKDIEAIWQDVVAAADELRSQGATRVALVGASMGGTASLVAAGQAPQGVEAIVTLSAPTSIEGLTADTDLMQTLTPAKLFLAGDLDTVAAQSATDLYDESLPPKRVELLTTADHGTDLLNGNQSEQTRTLILGWLARYVPVDAPSETA